MLQAWWRTPRRRRTSENTSNVWVSVALVYVVVCVQPPHTEEAISRSFDQYPQFIMLRPTLRCGGGGGDAQCMPDGTLR